MTPDMLDGSQPAAGSRQIETTTRIPRSAVRAVRKRAAALTGGAGRREYLLARLREADGPQYDTLCAEVAAGYPEKSRYWTAVQAARSVRSLLWDETTTIDSDGCIWLLPAGWEAAA